MASSYHNKTLQRFEGVNDNWHLGRQALRFDRIVKVLREVGARPPLLELGALGGAFAEQYTRALGWQHADVTCCDYASTPLRAAAARGFGTCQWNIEAEEAPEELVPSAYQTILFCEIIEHLVDPGDTLQRVLPLLKPGGLLLMTTPNLASLGNRIRLLLGKTPSLGAAPSLQTKAEQSLAALDHLRVCVPGEWAHLLEALGLELVRVTGCSYGPRHAETFRRRVTLALNRLLEDAPGHLAMGTLIVARKRLD